MNRNTSSKFYFSLYFMIIKGFLKLNLLFFRLPIFTRDSICIRKKKIMYSYYIEKNITNQKLIKLITNK